MEGRSPTSGTTRTWSSDRTTDVASDRSEYLETSETSQRSSKIPAPRPRSSVLPEVVDFSRNNEKEVSFADEKQVAGAGEKQVVEEDQLPEAIGEEGGKEVVHRSILPAVQERSTGQLVLLNRVVWDRRTKWTLAAISLVVLLAIGLSVGLALGLQSGSKQSELTQSPPQASEQIVGGSLNTAYYSMEGAFNGTGIAVSQQSFAGDADQEGVLVLYFQHHTGQLRYKQLSTSTGKWFGGDTSTIVAADAKNNTPIHAVSYVANYTNEWHVFYINRENMIRERYSSNSTAAGGGIWQGGVINDLNITVMDAEQAGFLACWYGNAYGDANVGSGGNNTDDEIGIRLWYASNDTTFQQLEWRKSNNAWVYEESWPNLNGYTSPGCFSWNGGATTYTAFVDLHGAGSIFWRDTAWNKISTSAHPINQWTNSSVAIQGLTGAANLAYTNSLYGQSQKDHFIRGYNVTWAAENTTLVPDHEFTVGDDPGLPGTRLAATELPDEDGSNELVLFFQTNGSDITEFRRDVVGGPWTKTPLSIPQD